MQKKLKTDKGKLTKTLVHEIQHAIQHIEGFAGGSNLDYWRDMGIPEDKVREYYENTAGEIEARDAAAREWRTDEARKEKRPDIDRTDVVFANDREVSYEIKYDKFGNKYWKIDSGKDIFKNLKSNTEIREAAYNYLISNRDNKITVKDKDNNDIIFIRVSAEEFTQSEESKEFFKNKPEIFNQKMRLIPSLQDILLNTNVNWTSPDSKNHKLFKKRGFSNYRGKVRIENVIFNYVVRVGRADFGDVFYDINLEVDSYLPHTNDASDINESTSVDTNIPQNDTDVNNNSMQNSSKDTEMQKPDDNIKYSKQITQQTEDNIEQLALENEAVETLVDEARDNIPKLQKRLKWAEKMQISGNKANSNFLHIHWSYSNKKCLQRKLPLQQAERRRATLTTIHNFKFAAKFLCYRCTVQFYTNNSTVKKAVKHIKNASLFFYEISGYKHKNNKPYKG